MKYKPLIERDPMPGDLVENLTQWAANASGSTNLLALLGAIERGFCNDPAFICPKIRWRIPGDLLRLMRTRVAEIVHQEFGGHWHHQAIVVKSDGRRFWTELGGAIVARDDLVREIDTP